MNVDNYWNYVVFSDETRVVWKKYRKMYVYGKKIMRSGSLDTLVAC